MNSLPKTVTRHRRDCDLNPGPSAPESSTLTTRLPSHLGLYTSASIQDYMACHAGDRRSFYTASVDAVYRAPSCTLDVGAIPHLPQSSLCALTSRSLSAVPVAEPRPVLSRSHLNSVQFLSYHRRYGSSVAHFEGLSFYQTEFFQSRQCADAEDSEEIACWTERERERERETARQVKESADAATGLSRYSAIQGSKCESRRVSDPASIQRGRLDGQAGQTMCCIVYIPTCAVPQKRHFRLAITTTRHMYM